MFTERALHPQCPPPRKTRGKENGMVPEHSPFLPRPALLTNLRHLPSFLPPGEPALPQGPCWQQATSWLVPTWDLYQDNMTTGMSQPPFCVHAMPWVVC